MMAKDIKKLSIRDIKQRLSNVNKLPRLCYTISNVIIYVDEANFARRRYCRRVCRVCHARVEADAI